MSRAIKNYNSVEWSNLFYYDPTTRTGLRWKENRYGGRKYKVLRAKAGSPAGNIHFNPSKNTKYATVSSEGTNWFAHRVVWILHNGYLPAEMVIDHIDGNSLNNEIGNLRVVPQRLNNRNASSRKDNNTGNSGVHFTTAKSHKEGEVYTYVTSTWYPDSNKRKCKHFSVNKHGLLPAFKMACEYRLKMIEELNQQGAGYTENHGK